MVLGTWSRKDRLYGGERATASPRTATWPSSSAPPSAGCPERAPAAAGRGPRQPTAPAFTPPPPERHITEGSFFVGDDRTICQIDRRAGRARHLRRHAAQGRRHDDRQAARRPDRLRDHARRVLQSQNEGWPEAHRNEARRDLNRAYDRLRRRLRPDQQDDLHRDRRRHRHPPHAEPGQVPRGPGRHAGHVPGGLRRGHRQGGQGRHHAEGRGRPERRPSRTVATAEEGLLVSLDRKGAVDLPYIATLYGKPEDADRRRAGRPHLPRPGDRSPGRPPTPTSRATSGRSSPPPSGRARTTPGTPRPCGPCSPRTCCPATSTPTSGPRGYPSATSRRSPPSSSASPPSAIQIGHLKKDAVWSVEADYARRAVGRRHRRIRHGAGQRHLAAGAGPEPEDPGHLRHGQQRRPRGAGRQPGGDAGRPREAEAHQGAVPVLGLRRPRPHRAAGPDLQRHLQQPPARGSSTARTSTSPA